MNPDNLASNYSVKFATFNDGSPKERIKLVMAFLELEYLNSLKNPSDKNRMVVSDFIERLSRI
jgi:hypothetical protein